jgi:hypothetical protein
MERERRNKNGRKRERLKENDTCKSRKKSTQKGKALKRKKSVNRQKDMCTKEGTPYVCVEGPPRPPLPKVC